ncbi:aldehyde dehydrogenase family protein [Methylovorus sp. SPW-M1]
MSTFHLLIDGHLQASDQSDVVINPATELEVGRAPRASATQVDQAVEAAHQAFHRWASEPEVRQQALRGAAAAIRQHADALARLITQEQGRPLHFTQGELAGAAATFEHYAGFAAPSDVVLQQDEQKRVSIERRPFGVVAAITPWNVPIILLVLKIAPALKAGNTVVAKPSEYTPLSTLYLGEILKDVFPPGVLNVIAGDGQVGARLASHPLVQKVTFTGSVATGKKLYASAAQDVKRLTLELGGNDAAIVLEDANVDAIAEKIFWGAFWNSGQVCFAIKRLYVHEAVFQPLLDALVKRAQKTRVGDGQLPGTELGPLTNKAQFERVISLVEDARRHGATIHSGGAALPGPGYFYPPTLVTGIGAGVALVDEEQFGPVLPLIPFREEQEAVRQANDSPFGLGASVWTANPERGLALVRQLQAGLAWVNQHGDIHPGAPKGGYKSSGLGYEGGLRGYDEFSELQVVNAALV